jgi:hypothetical protein
MPVKTTCAAILCLAICHAARGGDVAADATDSAEPAPFDPKGFSLDFRPQIWLPAVNGTVGVGNKTATVDASFLDIVQNTDSVIGLSGRLTVPPYGCRDAAQGRETGAAGLNATEIGRSWAGGGKIAR